MKLVCLYLKLVAAIVRLEFLTCALETLKHVVTRHARVVDVHTESLLRRSQVQEVDKVIRWCRVIIWVSDVCAETHRKHMH